MEKIREALDRMGNEASQAFAHLRADMKAGFDEQRLANAKIQAAVAVTQAAMVETQVAVQSVQTALQAMQEAVESTRVGMESMQVGMGSMQEAMVEKDREVLRQQHYLDEGLAHVDETFTRHRENIGTILFTYVEDIHGVKAAVRNLEQDRASILKRLDALERDRAS